MDNQFYDEQQEKNLASSQYDAQMAKLSSIEKTFVNSFTVLIKFLDGQTTKTEVVNQLKSVGTPDALKVVQAVKELDRTTKENKLDTSDLKAVLIEALAELKKIPKDHAEAPEQRESVSVSNISEVNSRLDKVAERIEKAISKIKLVAEAPKVDVKVPEAKVPIVNVAPTDLKPLQTALKDLLTGVKGIKIPEVPKTDLSKLEKEAEKHTKQLQKLIEKPIAVAGGGGGGNGTPYVDSTDKPVHPVLNPDGSIRTSSSTTNYTTRIRTDSVNTNYTYIGNAITGSSQASAVWQIKRLDTTTNLDKLWCDGDDSFNNIWDNRESLSYT